MSNRKIIHLSYQEQLVRNESIQAFCSSNSKETTGMLTKTNCLICYECYMEYLGDFITNYEIKNRERIIKEDKEYDFYNEMEELLR